MSRGGRPKAKRQRRSGPAPRPAQLNATFTTCTLQGYGPCRGRVEPHTIVEMPKGTSVPTKYVIGLCAEHRAISSNKRLAQQVGILIPRWVMQTAEGVEAEIDGFVKEAGVMRSIARSSTPGIITYEQFPMWMGAEREEWQAEIDFRAAIAHRDAMFDAGLERFHEERQAGIDAANRDGFFGRDDWVNPDAEMTVTEVRHADDGTHVVMTLADGSVVVGFDPAAPHAEGTGG